MKKMPAFTIAEVLISLTIIGIIAVLVLPSRMIGTKAKAFNTLFKTTFTQFQDGMTNASNIHKNSFVYVGDGSTNNSKYTLDTYMKRFFDAKSLPISDANPWPTFGGTVVEYSYTGTGVTISTGDNAKISKAYKLKSGAVILFPESSIKVMTQKGCDNSTPCPAYIDVNGTDEPNNIVSCEEDTTTTQNFSDPCEIDVNSGYDMFPIVIKKDHIYPATNACDYVLTK